MSNASYRGNKHGYLSWVIRANRRPVLHVAACRMQHVAEQTGTKFRAWAPLPALDLGLLTKLPPLYGVQCRTTSHIDPDDRTEVQPSSLISKHRPLDQLMSLRKEERGKRKEERGKRKEKEERGKRKACPKDTLASRGPTYFMYLMYFMYFAT